jgi:hypothetical protein
MTTVIQPFESKTMTVREALEAIHAAEAVLLSSAMELGLPIRSANIYRGGMGTPMVTFYSSERVFASHSGRLDMTMATCALDRATEMLKTAAEKFKKKGKR